MKGARFLWECFTERIVPSSIANVYHNNIRTRGRGKLTLSARSRSLLRSSKMILPSANTVDMPALNFKAKLLSTDLRFVYFKPVLNWTFHQETYTARIPKDKKRSRYLQTILLKFIHCHKHRWFGVINTDDFWNICYLTCYPRIVVYLLSNFQWKVFECQNR